MHNLMGKRFGKLTVIEKTHIDNCRELCWICLCDCGQTTKPIRSTDLRRGCTKSCGCFRKENQRKKVLKHGLEHTRIYRIWSGMRSRCYSPANRMYRCYGGRGITICDEWKDDITAFHKWAMANGYRDDLTIDRINNDGNYEPSNCRWATYSQQNKNRRKFTKKEN